MKAAIDRIEEGEVAVVVVENFGQLLIPVRLFHFPVREGMHLTIRFEPDPASESKTLKAVKNLRLKLLKRSRNH